MKKLIVFITLFYIIFLQIPVNADVVTPNYPYGNISGSLEFLLSLEKTFSRNESLLLWGGPGLTTNFSENPFQAFTLGGELAVEYRRYLSSDTYKRFFHGWYMGMGYLHEIHHKQNEDPINHIILGFGCKVGYKLPLLEKTKKNRIRRIVLEPYVSAGLTGYYEPDHILLFNPEKGALWFNVGLRIVFEKIFR